MHACTPSLRKMYQDWNVVRLQLNGLRIALFRKFFDDISMYRLTNRLFTRPHVKLIYNFERLTQNELEARVHHPLLAEHCRRTHFGNDWQ